MSTGVKDELSITLPLILSAKQHHLATFETGNEEIRFTVALGSYGGGKSLVAALAYLKHVAANAFIPGIHEDGSPPTSGIVAPSFSDIMQGPYKQLRRIASDDLIANEKLYHPYYEIEWVNGHVTKLCSAKGAINGPSWTGVWVDEIQEKPFKAAWHNIQARVRDGRVERMARTQTGYEKAGRLEVIVSGLATRNHVEDLFRYHDKPNQRLMILETKDNQQNLGGNAVEELKARMPDAVFEKDSEGWVLPQNVAYPWFTTQNNVDSETDLATLLDRPVMLGVDLRSHAAVVFMIPGAFTWSQGQPAGLIVDEWLPENYSAAMIATEIKSGRFPWRIAPNHSAICMDPTASIDEVRAFEKAFPGVPVFQYRKGPLSEARNGRRAVATALRDERKITRLAIAGKLDGDHERGCGRMFREWDGRRDGRFEHVADAVRYVVQHGIPNLLLTTIDGGINTPKDGLPKGTTIVPKTAPSNLPTTVVTGSSMRFGGPRITRRGSRY